MPYTAAPTLRSLQHQLSLDCAAMATMSGALSAASRYSRSSASPPTNTPPSHPRTREGMAVARARGRLKGRRPKLTTKQQTELCRMHGTGDYTITDLAELFNISRPTVYRTLATAETRSRAT